MIQRREFFSAHRVVNKLLSADRVASQVAAQVEVDFPNPVSSSMANRVIEVVILLATAVQTKINLTKVRVTHQLPLILPTTTKTRSDKIRRRKKKAS